MTDEYRRSAMYEHKEMRERNGEGATAPARDRLATRRGARARWAASAAVILMPMAAWALGELAVELAGWATAPGAGVDAIIAPAIVGLGAVVCGYLALSALVMVAAALSGSIPSWIAAFAPTAWRRIVATAAGVTLSAGIAVPAFASDIAPGWSTAVATAGVDASPGWAAAGSDFHVAGTTDALPGWIDGPVAGASTDHSAAAPSPEPTSDSSPVAQSTHRVAAGESLWGIAAELIGTDDSAAVAVAWPALYAANRDVIGDDPGLILPGQELEIPSELAR